MKSKYRSHKNQHFIPRCYLSAWCDSNCLPNQTPYIWCFSRDGESSKRKSPKNIFYEKDMYTITLNDGTRDLRIEYGLSQLEGQFSKLRKEKIEKREELNPDDRAILCLFAAAMQGRTTAFREHQRNQWREALDMMDNMKESIKNLLPEQKRHVATPLPSADRENKNIFTYDDVKEIVDNTTQVLLPSFVRTAAPKLYRLDLAILITDNKTGFVTSDDPCVWFDSEAYKRPPLFRNPALMYDTINITLPLSPSVVLFLNRKGINGYRQIGEHVVDDVNRKTRFYTNEYFVVNSNITKDIWFKTGEEPEDSREKKQAKKSLDDSEK